MARPEKQLVTFEIDGREVQAEEGTMLVDAAKNGDVEIPYFCYERKLGQPVGACRMCLVEIEGMPKLQTSCSTPVKDGMVVITTSDNVKQAQNAVVEFLLVNHPLDCPVCDKGGECPLQDISFGWGAGRSRYIEPKRHFKKPLELSPLVAIDRERCILCYRCVRFSQEVAEDYQLVFLERGDHTFVGTHDGRPYLAPFSGNIIELCPVGALTSTAYRFRARPWDIEDAGSICTLCPSQCNVKFTIRDDKRVVRVLARENHDVDDGWLCDMGRFGYQAIHAKERVTAPLVRDGGYLREVSWERALSEGAAALKKAGERTLALAGGSTSNEEGFLLQHLMRRGLGSPHVDSRTSGRVDGAQVRALARPDLSARVADIDHAGAILIFGTELVDESPILDLRVRKAVRRNGSRLVVVSSPPSSLDPTASRTVRTAPGAEEAALAALAAALGSPRAEDAELSDLARRAGAAEAAIREAAGILSGADDVVVLWSERLGHGERGARTVDALLALAGVLGVADQAEGGLIEVPAAANGRGLREVGCLPDLGPGLADAPAQGMTAAEAGRAVGEGIDALLLMHVDPVREHPEQGVWEDALENASAVIAFADFRTEGLEKHANVVFPAESHAEKEGTVTHPDGRIQRVRQAIGHPHEVRSEWSVLVDLCNRLGAEVDARTAPEVTARLAEDVGIYGGLTLDEIGGKGVRWQDRDTASALGDAPLPEEGLAQPPDPPEGIALGALPSLWTSPVCDHSASLRFLAPSQRAAISPDDARRLGISAGDQVLVAADGQQVRATAVVRSGVRPGSVFLIKGTAEDNATALMNGVPRAVEVSKA
jgi:NADH-quinone oxidoreductase subunit G